MISQWEFRSRKLMEALAGMAQWIEQNKGLPVGFPVRPRAWVVGQAPSRGHMRDNHTLMFLFLFLPSPLSKNKQINR